MKLFIQAGVSAGVKNYGSIWDKETILGQIGNYLKDNTAQVEVKITYADDRPGEKDAETEPNS